MISLPPRVPPGLVVCHVGTEFSATEVEHIRNAGTAWTLVSEGRTRFHVTQDLDLERPDSLRGCLVMGVSKEASITKEVIEAHGGANVIAFTIEDHVYMVMDKVSPQDFVWVVIHEFGHVLGLSDLDTKGDIMSEVGPFRGVWFTEGDKALCRDGGICP